MNQKDVYFPARLIFFILALLAGIMNICQIYLLKDIHPIPKLIIGSDYICFYSASKNLYLKGTPYALGWYTSTIDDYLKPLLKFAHYGSHSPNPWYCFPPVAASLNYPLSFLEIETAARFSFFLLLAAVVVSYGLIVGTFDYKEKSAHRTIFLYGLLTIAISYPVYFLIARGHLIGITFFLLAAGLYLFKRGNPFSGVCFGIATGMFLFPGLIIVPLIFLRRYKVIVYMVATLFLLILLCPDLWWFFVKHIIMFRITTKDILQQNCSLAAVFLNGAMVFEKIGGLAGGQIKLSHFYYEIAKVIYGILFFSMILLDIFILNNKRNLFPPNIQTAQVFMYIPFMIALPKGIFPYTVVVLLFLIPPVCMLTSIFSKLIPNSILFFIITGIALSQFQAQAFDMLLDSKIFSFHFFPGLGILFVMIGCVAFKIWLWRQNMLQLYDTNISK